MANSPDRSGHRKLYEFGANGEFGIQADKTIFNARHRKKETSYGRKPGAPTSGYRAYVAKSFRYFASGAVFCLPGFAPDSSGARNRDIGVAGRYTSGTGAH